MSSKINLQTCEYARKSSIFQDNQLILKKNNKIYRKGEEIKPDTSGTNGKVVSGMSAHGLWFSASTSTEKITIYKKDIIDLAPNAHEVFMSYII